MMETAKTVRAEELVESQAWVDGAIQIKNLVQWFKENPRRDYVAVVEQDVVVGLAGRDELSRSMMGQYGYSLMAHRPIRDEAIRDVVVVEAATELSGVVRKLVGSGLKGRAFYQDLIIVKGGQFQGLASVRRLLIEEVLENLAWAWQSRWNSELGIAHAAARNGETFSGSLRDFPVADLAQILSLGAKIGELRIQGDGDESGSVFFSAGRIVHASAGPKTGTEALQRLLAMERGAFRFFQGIATAQETIDAPVMVALLDAGRVMDEERIAGVA